MIVGYNQNSVMKIFLTGVYVYYVGMLIYYYILFKSPAARIISLFGLLLFLCGFWKLRKNIGGVDKTALVIFYVFIGICFAVVVFGVPEAIMDGRFTELLFDRFLFWPYLIGLSFLVVVQKKQLNIIIKFCLLNVATAVLFSLLFFGDLFLNPAEIYRSAFDSSEAGNIVNRSQEPATMLFSLGAFLIYYKYFPIKWKFLIVFAFFPALLSVLLMGRRSATAILIGHALIPYIIWLIHSKGRLIKTVFVVIMLVVIGFLSIPEKKMSSFLEDNFEILSNRADADTRSGVEDDFFRDMSSVEDWIFGRGLTGTYRCPSQLMSEDNLHRYTIETGYLNLILHGGLVLLIPYVLLLLTCSYLGFFKSRNLFVKSCAGYVFFRLLQLYPGGHLTFSLHVILMFFFMRICASREWRLMSDKEIISAAFKQH